MEFSEYVESHRKEIYSKICEYLPIKKPEEYHKMVRDYSDRQGKYRRPGLLMLTGELFGAKAKDLVLPAAAMQLSEDWILMHDDVEDDSEMRRGKPAIQRLYGLEQAINAGDAAHIAMWKMLKDYMLENPRAGSRLYDKFYDLLKRTVEGQYVELKFIKETRSLAKATEELYFKVAKSKTCYYTIFGPMQLGAVVAGKNEKILNVLEEIGTPAGMAFQIMDDVLDVVADEKHFGKTRHGDLYEGKLTLIILHAYQKATPAEKKEIDRIYNKDRKDKTDTEIGFLVDLIEKYEGVEYARRVAGDYGERAGAILKKNLRYLPDNKYREVFESAITELFVRNR